jgi:hypothetical protein
MVSLSISPNLHYQQHFWLFPMEPPQSPLNGVLYGTGHAVPADRADIALAKSWLEECRAEHQNDFTRCVPVPLSLEMSLKVIDCQTRRVRALHKHESYVFLSYVWGKTNTNKTFDGLQLPEMIEMPIEDAVCVSQQLGIPRLWVDQYCIDQGSSEEKHNTMRAMDRIYGGAEITIISAGNDPSGGLPGINGMPRQAQRVVHFGVGPYVAVGDIIHQIKSSPWNSRAWTYQEGVLAPRRLVFSDSQIYFQCNGTHCLESLNAGFQGAIIHYVRCLWLDRELLPKTVNLRIG